MKKLIIFYFLFALLPVADAVCVAPVENLKIKGNAVLCHGIYNIESGIEVVEDNLTADCNNSVLMGNGVGYGILLNNRHNITVQNCNITNYEIGVYLDSTNKSILKSNYLTKNKFGIALFNSFDNNIDNNFLAENLGDEITYLPLSLIEEKEPIEAENKEEISSPQKIMEEVVRIKKPFLNEDEVLSEINLIFDRYFNLTQENLEIRRTVFYNESDKSTRIVLNLRPKKALTNVSIYERIPKCVSAYVNQILFETGGYEVVKNDPLVLWSFTRLDNEKEISYKVFKNIDEECRNLLLAFGIASVFEQAEEKTEKKNSSTYMLVFFIILFAVLISYFTLMKPHKES